MNVLSKCDYYNFPLPDEEHGGGGGIDSVRVDLDTFTSVLMERMNKSDLLEDVRRAFKAMDVRSQGFISLESFDKVCIYMQYCLLYALHYY